MRPGGVWGVGGGRAGGEVGFDGLDEGGIEGVGDVGGEGEGFGAGFDAEEIAGGGVAGDEIDPGCAGALVGGEEEDGKNGIEKGAGEAEPEVEGVFGGEAAGGEAGVFPGRRGGGVFGGGGAEGGHAGGELIDDAEKADAAGVHIRMGGDGGEFVRG